MLWLQGEGMSLLCVCVHDVVGLEGGPIYPGSILILPQLYFRDSGGGGSVDPSLKTITIKHTLSCESC